MATSDTKHRIYTMAFGDVYPHYVAKAEKKGRTKREIDQIVQWLTGYTQRQLMAQVRKGTEPLMREIRYLDKLIDELAKGKSMDKILRTPQG